MFCEVIRCVADLSLDVKCSNHVAFLFHDLKVITKLSQSREPCGFLFTVLFA